LPGFFGWECSLKRECVTANVRKIVDVKSGASLRIIARHKDSKVDWFSIGILVIGIVFLVMDGDDFTRGGKRWPCYQGVR
jgi:hypothetical protein